MAKITRYFAITHEEYLGPAWMNKDALISCINKRVLGEPCAVEDVTEQVLRLTVAESRASAEIVHHGYKQDADVCDHDWVSAVNEVVKSGEICPKCNSVRR